MNDVNNPANDVQQEDSNSSIYITKYKVPRKELFTMVYYPMIDPLMEDNWISVLGEKTFCYWLRLLSLADRSNSSTESIGNNVPRSLNSIPKLFGIARSTFYDKCIIPLWEHGLIELFEYENGKKSNLPNPINIVVLPYPLGDSSKKHEPLVKLRDYKKDYSSKQKEYFKAYKERMEGTQSSLPSPLELRVETVCEYLTLHKVKPNVVKQVKELLMQTQHPYELPLAIVDEQLNYMYEQYQKGQSIYSFAAFFVTGIIGRSISYMNTQNALDSVNALHTSTLPPSSNSKFYDWLNERE